MVAGSNQVESNSTGTVSRALQLLAILADANSGVTVKYVSETMGLAPSTAHRLLNLLKQEGFVEAAAEKHQYAIGPGFYRVAARVVGSVSKADIAQPVIEAAAARFDETVLFGQYLQAERALSFAGRADGRQRLTYRVDMHRPLSLVWGASGRSILAFLPDDVINQIIEAEGPAPANGSSPDKHAIWCDIHKIREIGWAMSENEKLPDPRGIAAPVFGPSGVIGAICLTMPSVRPSTYSLESLGQSMMQSARILSERLGARLGCVSSTPGSRQ